MQNGLGDDATFQGDGHADAAVLRNGTGNGAPRELARHGISSFEGVFF